MKGGDDHMAELTLKDLKKEIYLTMHKALEMVDLAEDGYMKNRLSSLSEADELAREIWSKEEALTASLAKMASKDKEARSLLSVPSHIGNITISIMRIIEGSRIRIKEGLLFSDKADIEARKLFDTSKDALKKAGEAAITGAKTTIDSVFVESDALERMTNEFATAHEDRLVTGQCQPKSSSTYLSILYAFEDMGAHVKDAVKKIAVK